MNAAELILIALGVYAAAGLVFALWFVTVGVGRLDPVARGGTWGFRALILPASVALWPAILFRIASHRPPSPGAALPLPREGAAP